MPLEVVFSHICDEFGDGEILDALSDSREYASEVV